MATYAETLVNVRSWANRDSAVLTDALIKKFLTFAADKAYRTLRIPALETTLDFTVTSGDIVSSPSNFGTEVNMTVPSDLIQLIFIQKKGSGLVWNQKVDPRTFHDRFADKKDFDYYTRVGSTFILHGSVQLNDVLQVHYYRRLVAVDSTYKITPANYSAQTTALTTMTRRASGYSSPDATLAALGRTTLYFATGTTTAQIDALTASTPKAATESGYDVAAEMEPAFIENWLRDENEKILLYGALVEAFDYLEEEKLSAKYKANFEEEIIKLNQEEEKRASRGGNTSINFSGMGLI